MIVKELGTLGERQRAIACAASEAGHRQTALRLFDLALRNFVEAQHNLFADSPMKRHLMEQAQDCMDHIMPLAPHRIDRLDVPFEEGPLPAVLHIRDEAGPLLFFIPGMDGTKETSSIGPLATPFVSRGFRVFAMDGPGQGAARVLRGIRLRPGSYARAVQAALDHLQAAGRWNGRDAWVLGSSMGTRWGLEAAAADARIAGLALVHAAFGDQRPLFYHAPPRFRKVLAYMTGLGEEALRTFIAATELAPDLGVRCPTLVCIGEYDPLTSVAEARRLYARTLLGPKELYVFGDAFHGGEDLEALGGASAVEAAADWLRDRAGGKPLRSGESFVPASRGLGMYGRQPLERWHTDLGTSG
jgi:pimeloyl-ACP methyl ester carboxylesterase